MTDLKVFRAELTGLTPGTDYQFRIGKQSPTYRFRTMPAKATDTDPLHLRRRLRRQRPRGRQQHPGRPAGPDVRRHRRRPRLRQRQFGRRQPRLPPQLQQAHDRPRRPADPHGRLHRQPRGRRRLQQAPRKAPFFYALFDGLFPETGFATLDFGDYLSLVLLDTGHTSPDRRRRRPTGWRRRSRPGPSIRTCSSSITSRPIRRSASMDGQQGQGRHRRRQPQALGAAVREVPRAGRARASRPHLQAHQASARRPGQRQRRALPRRRLLGPAPARRRSPKNCRISRCASRDYHLSLHRIQGEERFHLALDESGRVMDVCHTSQRKSGAVRVQAPQG